MKGVTMAQYKYQVKKGVKWMVKFNYSDPKTGKTKTEYKRIYSAFISQYGEQNYIFSLNRQEILRYRFWYIDAFLKKLTHLLQQSQTPGTVKNNRQQKFFLFP